jgi:hypothetical protein
MTDEELGHVAAVSSVLHSLTNTERSVFCNGFGSELPFLSLFTKAIPHYYRVLYEPAARWHDIAYCMGGEEWHRDVSDEYFLRLMVDITKTLPPRKMIAGFVWCATAWRAVSVGGRFSFEYRTRPLTLSEMQREARELMKG